MINIRWRRAAVRALVGGRPGPQVGSFALPAEEAEDLHRRAVRAAEPVRDAGVELRGLAGGQHQVLVTEDQAQATAEDVDPLVALVGLLLRRSRPVRRDEELVG